MQPMQWQDLLAPNRFSDAAAAPDTRRRSDYDTIICSTLFRRLQDKAQVFPLDEDDYVRTRLTHSLEVSAISKKLGEHTFAALQAAGVDSWFDTHTARDFADVLLCAGLVHDIGNPPYGHFGEYAIREWFRQHLDELYLGGEKVSHLLTEWQRQDLYRFEGNAQSLRLLAKTPHLGGMQGFDLSYAVLGAMMKYPVSAQQLEQNNPCGYRKMGYYYAEKELFEDISRRTGMDGRRHPLSYLLEAADDIAYHTSDVEDAVVKKVLNYRQIAAAFADYAQQLQGIEQEAFCRCTGMLEQLYQTERAKGTRKPGLTALQRWNQQLQTMMIEDAAAGFVRHYDRLMNGTLQHDLFTGTVSGHLLQAIAQLSEQMVYTSPVKIRTELYGRRVIASLMGHFLPAAVKYDTAEEMSFIDRRVMDTVSEFYKAMYHTESRGRSEADKLYLRILMITDYLSGMTDNYAKRLYQDLFG